jgi:hypothetical protein
MGVVGSGTEQASGLGGGMPQPRWLAFVSRWAFAVSCVEVALLALAVGWFLPVSEAGSAGPEYGELAAALASPALYRLLAVLDIAVWIGLGGLLIGLAAVLAGRAPIASVLIAACGLGQILGMTGGYLRLHGIGEFASRHGKAALDDPQVLASFLGLQDVMYALFNSGALLWTAGFVLVALVAWRVAAFPRWLVVVFGLLGGVAVLDLGLYLATGDFPLDVVKFPLLAAALFSTAFAFRRRARVRWT